MKFHQITMQSQHLLIWW